MMYIVPASPLATLLLNLNPSLVTELRGATNVLLGVIEAAELGMTNNFYISHFLPFILEKPSPVPYNPVVSPPVPVNPLAFPFVQFPPHMLNMANMANMMPNNMPPEGFNMANFPAMPNFPMSIHIITD